MELADLAQMSDLTAIPATEVIAYPVNQDLR